MAVGAGMVGMAKKAGLVDKLPAVPFIGRIGTLAILAHFWARNGGGQLATDISLAAASIAGYQLGSQGAIDGEGDDFE